MPMGGKNRKNCEALKEAGRPCPPKKATKSRAKKRGTKRAMGYKSVGKGRK
jgi:hypothetical protein